MNESAAQQQAQEQWNAVDRYITDQLVPSGDGLEQALQASAEAGLPPINVSPNQGKLLNLLAVVQKARRILEIGTLGGYSPIWLARALPNDGRLITLEDETAYAKVARANIARAGLGNAVEVRVGSALETLPVLVAENAGSFDLIFINADKPNTPGYFECSLKLSRPGTLIITDNVVRKGALADEASDDSAVQGMRRFLEMLANEPRVSATAIQTVGSKGYDGFALAVVTKK